MASRALAARSAKKLTALAENPLPDTPWIAIALGASAFLGAGLFNQWVLQKASAASDATLSSTYRTLGLTGLGEAAVIGGAAFMLRKTKPYQSVALGTAAALMGAAGTAATVKSFTLASWMPATQSSSTG